MTDRRSLVEGLKATPPLIATAREKEFVYGSKSALEVPTTPQVNRVPISTRIRSDFASALKRASLERQLAGATPNTLQDILEQAIEPWLKANGYLP